MSARKAARAPRPELLRKPDTGFGWIDMRMLHDGWLREIGSDACAVLILLAIAADKHGASFYGRARMGSMLGMDLCRVDAALDCLQDLELVAMRPWKHGSKDGVWQLLPLPVREQKRGHDTQKIDKILEQMINRKRG